MNFPAIPGWSVLLVALDGPSPILADGTRCSSLPLLAAACYWCCWVLRRQSWLTVLGAVPRHSWLDSAAAGGGWSLAKPS